jgi:hypothetical protein
LYNQHFIFYYLGGGTRTGVATCHNRPDGRRSRRLSSPGGHGLCLREEKQIRGMEHIKLFFEKLQKTEKKAVPVQQQKSMYLVNFIFGR